MPSVASAQGTSLDAPIPSPHLNTLTSGVGWKRRPARSRHASTSRSRPATTTRARSSTTPSSSAGGGASGRLGYDSTDYWGDEAGRWRVSARCTWAGWTAVAVSAGLSHTCAILEGSRAQVLGSGQLGQIGYDSTDDKVGEAGEMASLGAVYLGAGRTTVAVSVGRDHTCAILDNAELMLGAAAPAGPATTRREPRAIRRATWRASVRCTWARAGPPSPSRPAGLTRARSSTTPRSSVGGTAAPAGSATTRRELWRFFRRDGEPQGGVPGAGRTAVAVSAGFSHTCAILDSAELKCWGSGQFGKLGYDSTDDKGDEAGEMASLARYT